MHPQPSISPFPAPSPQRVHIAAISDTHGNNQPIQQLLTDNIQGDIFIHAGDFTYYCKSAHYRQFIDLVSRLKFKHKIVIPGNHQLTLDPDIPTTQHKSFGLWNIPQDCGQEKLYHRFKQAGITLLRHDYIEVQGLKIFASAYHPQYSCTAFQISETRIQQIWEGVPRELDVMITHGPPYNVLDRNVEGQVGGSISIRNHLDVSTVKVHIFGHIHEAKGQKYYRNTLCCNVAEKMKFIVIDKSDKGAPNHA